MAEEDEIPNYLPDGVRAPDQSVEVQLNQPDDLEVEPIECKNYQKENESQLMMLFGFTVYLYISLFLFQSSDKYRIIVNENDSPQEKKLHGDGSCNFDSNATLETLIYFSFFPSIILRAFGAIKYRKHDPLDFEKAYNRIEIFWHATFGSWTLYNLYIYMNISQNCRELFKMAMINY